jgi:hypothetical protein
MQKATLCSRLGRTKQSTVFTDGVRSIEPQPMFIRSMTSYAAPLSEDVSPPALNTRFHPVCIRFMETMRPGRLTCVFVLSPEWPRDRERPCANCSMAASLKYPP